jgi:DNA-binding winged helix-turn-helix (wHTH) protein
MLNPPSTPDVDGASPAAVETYRFGGFLLDVRRRLLIHGRESRPIHEKPFVILTALLEADGRTVTKEELYSRAWPNGIVSEANLTQHVSMLRGLLGESARRHAHVITVPTLGYRLGVGVERKVGLRMKETCERCSCLLEPNADARICSYECTFCPECAAGLAATCPNCGGELVVRPRRVIAAS